MQEAINATQITLQSHGNTADFKLVAETTYIHTAHLQSEMKRLYTRAVSFL